MANFWYVSWETQYTQHYVRLRKKTVYQHENIHILFLMLIALICDHRSDIIFNDPKPQYLEKTNPLLYICTSSFHCVHFQQTYCSMHCHGFTIQIKHMTCRKCRRQLCLLNLLRENFFNSVVHFWVKSSSAASRTKWEFFL